MSLLSSKVKSAYGTFASSSRNQEQPEVVRKLKGTKILHQSTDAVLSITPAALEGYHNYCRKRVSMLAHLKEALDSYIPDRSQLNRAYLYQDELHKDHGEEKYDLTERREIKHEMDKPHEVPRQEFVKVGEQIIKRAEDGNIRPPSEKQNLAQLLIVTWRKHYSFFSGGVHTHCSYVTVAYCDESGNVYHTDSISLPAVNDDYEAAQLFLDAPPHTWKATVDDTQNHPHTQIAPWREKNKVVLPATGEPMFDEKWNSLR